MEFDHVVPKINNVTSLTHANFERIQEEIDRCEVVCANCHRRRTKKRRQLAVENGEVTLKFVPGSVGLLEQDRLFEVESGGWETK